MYRAKEQEMVNIKQDMDVLRAKMEPDTEKLCALAQSSQLEPFIVSSDDENIDTYANSQNNIPCADHNSNMLSSSEDEDCNYESSIANSLTSGESVPKNQYLPINWNKKTGSFDRLYVIVMLTEKK